MEDISQMHRMYIYSTKTQYFKINGELISAHSVTVSQSYTIHCTNEGWHKSEKSCILLQLLIIVKLR